MKKILLLSLLFIPLLVSCNYVTTKGEEEGTTELQYYKNHDPIKISVFEFEYHGHDYLYLDSEGYSYISEVVHNPDCKTCKARRIANQEVENETVW